MDPIDEAAKIKDRLYRAGYKLLDIDRIYGLARGTAGDTLRNPNAAGERAIAAALGTRPHLLWRRRYDASGQRRAHQDYSRPPTMSQRRKSAEA